MTWIWLPTTFLYALWTIVVEPEFDQFTYKLVLVAIGLILSAVLWYTSWPVLKKPRTLLLWLIAMVLASILGGTAGFIWSVATIPAVLFFVALRLVSGPVSRCREHQGIIATTWLVVACGYCVLANQRYFLRQMDYLTINRQPPIMQANPLYGMYIDGYRDTEPPTTAESEENIRVYFQGDSIMWGFPYPATASIPARFKHYMQATTSVTVWNAGQPSQSLVQIRARIHEISSRNPHYFVLVAGYQWHSLSRHAAALKNAPTPAKPTQAWLWNLTPPFARELFLFSWRNIGQPAEPENLPDKNRQLYASELQALIQELASRHVELVILENPALNLDPEIRDITTRIARKNQIPIVPTIDSFTNASQYAYNDSIHPRRAGLDTIGKRLAKYLGDRIRLK